jgi:DNA polymerase III delta subunit
MNDYTPTLEKARSIHCFALCGEDTVSREHARGLIIASLETICGAPLTHEHYDSSIEPFTLFVQKMLSPSLFADLRVFHIKHAQTLTGGDLEELESALSVEIPDVYIIIEIDDAKKTAARVIKKLAIEKRCAATPPTCLYEEFPRPRDYEIAKWLVANTPRLIGRRIALPDAEYLADRVGFDLDILHGELRKLDLHLGKNASIDRDAIDHLTDALRERTVFELSAAVGRKDFVAVMETIDALFSVKTYMPLMVSALSRHFWSLFRINRFLNSNPSIAHAWAASKNQRGPSTAQTEAGMAIGKAAGILTDGRQGRIFPVLVKSGIVEQATGFSGRELSRILAMLLEFEAGFKTGRIEATEQALQLLCFKIIRIGTLENEGAVA